MIIFGIDPGKMGALAIIDAGVVFFRDYGLDGTAGEIISEAVLQFGKPDVCAIEEPLVLGCRSRASIASIFQNFGEWVGAVEAHGIKPVVVTADPRVPHDRRNWLRFHGISKGADKQVHIALARKYYPEADLGAEVFKLKKDQPRLDGRADGLLVGHMAAVLNLI